MTQYVNVPLSETMYRRLKSLADAKKQDVADTIAEHLSQTLETNNVIALSEADPLVERENNAYKRLHPELVSTFLGQYVAIYEGQLIDNDETFGALFERIDDQYPDCFVLIKQVASEPETTLHYRSLRFVDVE